MLDALYCWLSAPADNLGALAGAAIAGAVSLIVAIYVVWGTVSPVYDQINLQSIAALKELRSALEADSIRSERFLADIYSSTGAVLEEIERISTHARIDKFNYSEYIGSGVSKLAAIVDGRSDLIRIEKDLTSHALAATDIDRVDAARAFVRQAIADAIHHVGNLADVDKLERNFSAAEVLTDSRQAIAAIRELRTRASKLKDVIDQSRSDVTRQIRTIHSKIVR